MTAQLASLSSAAIGALDPASLTLVQPIGAVEQHGPHLPVDTDARLAHELAHRAVARLDSVLTLVLPTLSYGTSDEHRGWAGTISMSTATLMNVCLDLASSLASWGSPTLVFVNGHGGQNHLLDVVRRDIRVRTGLDVFTVTPSHFGSPESLTLHDGGDDIHAGISETSMMLHLAPELVDLEAAEPGGFGAARAFAGREIITLEGAVSPAWLSADITHNGVIGDPRGATAAIGAALVDYRVGRLAAALGEIAQFRFPAPAPITR